MNYAVTFIVFGLAALIALRGRPIYVIAIWVYPPIIVMRVLIWLFEGGVGDFRESHPYLYSASLAVVCVVAGITIRRIVDAWRDGEFTDFWRR